MSKQDYPPDFLRLLKSVEAKRPKTVIDHILEHGQITAGELKDTYGYNHPPRAIRYDVLCEEAAKVNEEAPEYVKNVLRNHFQKTRSQ